MISQKEILSAYIEDKITLEEFKTMTPEQIENKLNILENEPMFKVYIDFGTHMTYQGVQLTPEEEKKSRANTDSITIGK